MSSWMIAHQKNAASLAFSDWINEAHTIPDSHRSKKDRKGPPHWETNAEAEPVRLELTGRMLKLLRRYCMRSWHIDSHPVQTKYKMLIRYAGMAADTHKSWWISS
jgi:hypothetical protein